MYMYMYMYMDKASFGLASKTALGRTSFGLVDFGMAVDVRRWLGSSKEVGAEIPLIGDMVHVSAVISHFRYFDEVVEYRADSMKDGGWKHLEVGGDCRLPVSLCFMLHRDFRWL